MRPHVFSALLSACECGATGMMRNPRVRVAVRHQGPGVDVITVPLAHDLGREVAAQYRQVPTGHVLRDPRAKLIELLDMPRPFAKLKAMDVEEVTRAALKK